MSYLYKSSIFPFTIFGRERGRRFEGKEIGSGKKERLKVCSIVKKDGSVKGEKVKVYEGGRSMAG